MKHMVVFLGDAPCAVAGFSVSFYPNGTCTQGVVAYHGLENERILQAAGGIFCPTMLKNLSIVLDMPVTVAIQLSFLRMPPYSANRHRMS